MTEVKMWNYSDLLDVRRGLIPPQSVRTVSVEALVDTGAVTLVIPEDVALTLGLELLPARTVILADGTRRPIPVATGLRIEILGRQMLCDAYVTPAGSTTLVGQIPLEYLDLIVDPGTREIRVRSEAGPEAKLLRVAA